MSREQKYLFKLIEEIEQKLDWDASTGWKHNHFIRLGNLLYDETSHDNYLSHYLSRILSGRRCLFGEFFRKCGTGYLTIEKLNLNR